MEFEIATILDQSKIGNNGDKIDMMLLPVASMQKIADNNLTFQYAVRVDDDFEQQAEKEIEQILADNPRFSVRTLSAAIAQNSNFLQGMQLALAVAIGFIGCFSILNSYENRRKNRKGKTYLSVGQPNCPTDFSI